MVRYKEKRIVRNSKNNWVVITKAPFAKGKITNIEKEKFTVQSSIKKKTSLENKFSERNIIHIIKKENRYDFQKPETKGDVILKYKDKKSKLGEYENPEDNLPIEVVTLSGKTLYKRI